MPLARLHQRSQLPLLCGALNTVLSKSKFLLGDEFSVADVAMGAYFAYVTMFFPDVNYEARA
jgi:glutathione S-transferase